MEQMQRKVARLWNDGHFVKLVPRKNGTEGPLKVY